MTHGWVDPPEVPDHREWVSPPPVASAAVAAPAPSRAGTVAWRRVLPALAVFALGVAGQLTGRGEPAPSGPWLEPPDDTIVARYEASEGSLGQLVHARDGTHGTAAAADLWAEWVSIVPPHLARRVELFELASDGTGPGTFAAYVSPLDPEGRRWRLAVDPADAREHPEHYARTLVHELAHILTLSEVIEPRRGDGSLAGALRGCGGPAVTDACLDRDSLLARWIEEFWTADDVATADELRRLSGLAWEDAVIARHGDVRTRFVTPYATTDPEEDIAESLEALAAGVRPSPRSEAARKLEFLRSDPAVLALVIEVEQRLRR